ncbi:conjugal transfer protein MobC [Myroides marinus]|uniref:conjugal transfer protein MobC n=1 Tax=Myroides marinus TaxID=703342 RepID=UPI0025749651|nr:conjugal transfer protein MobC [Myroides marinus]MDM1380720.1 YWFCY domain-containing protein [Myroides marinus]MDM1387966.1 YWFCY domain-containing protein [Myroides marinus]MDM1395204.1 YWFCY domain-containing protein [Myroides marinus]
MQNEDDLRALSKILSFLRAVSILILLMHIYWFCYSLFMRLGLTHPVANKILLGFNAKANLFASPIYTKLFSILLLGLSLWGNKGVKSQKITLKKIAVLFFLGIGLFFLNFIFLKSNLIIINILYITSLAIGYILLLVSGAYLSRLINQELLEDVFNLENESFYQETRLLQNQYSVNLPSKFYYRKKWHRGWINVVNPFRATIVLGTPGSGKSYAVINNFIKQQIEKGFALYLYDFKYDDLSTIAYNHLLLHKDKYEVTPKFYVINFDDPKKSHRCNPINPKFITDISDAYESAYTIMLNLNRSWIQKQGDFFVESPIILLAAIIWFLKIYKDGKYCTFPHAIELLNKRYKDVFTILTSYDSLENYLSPFMDAWEGGAQDQLQGQIASAKIPLSRMISPSLYWVMSGDDFSLDINNPKEPKILCVGNNPDRQSIYSAALGLYNSRIVKLINKKDQLKSSVIIDELPTIYFRGLDNLIATARSNKVAVCLGFQDFSQLVRDYGDKESKVIQNTVGNIFSGQVVGDTAKSLSERFGKILQKRQSISINRQDRSTSISTQLDMLIPASKISSLSQGMFVGSVSDDFTQKIEQKFFHAQILVDSEKVKQEELNYKKIPTLTSFTDYKGNDHLDRAITDNYNQIKKDIDLLIKNEIKRIENDSDLVHLLNNDN